MNVFTFTGNLGKDCRTNNVSGTDVCNFSVAVTSGYGERKKTDWVECAYWGKGGAAVAPYLLKGQQVAVSGELSLKPADGQYAAKLELRVENLSLVGGKAQQNSQQAPQQPAPTSTGGATDFDDDIPFAPIDYRVM